MDAVAGAQVVSEGKKAQVMALNTEGTLALPVTAEPGLALGKPPEFSSKPEAFTFHPQKDNHLC